MVHETQGCRRSRTAWARRPRRADQRDRSRDRPAVAHPARPASRARGPVLAVGHQQVGRLPATERRRRAAVQLGVQAAPAGRPLRLSRRPRSSHSPRDRRRSSCRSCSSSASRRGSAALGLLVMTLIVQLTVPGRLADPPDLGGDGARASWPAGRPDFARSLDRALDRRAVTRPVVESLLADGRAGLTRSGARSSAPQAPSLSSMRSKPRSR